MARFVLGAGSRAKLAGVHPDLVRVVERAIELTGVDFRVTCGLRTAEEQRALVAKGASKTMRSRHLTGHAVDVAALVGGAVSWDVPHYAAIAEAVLAAAAELDVPVVWGGTWRRDAAKPYARFLDGPHFELDARAYPGSAEP
jgi:peptidoglycan L-alanyl-D-glutamate endopeptidase CwlK